MKITNTNNKKYMSLDPEFAFLLDGVKGNYLYKFSYNINHVRALIDDASHVIISIYSNPLTLEENLFSENEPLVSSILLAQSRCKDVRRFNLLSPIINKISDFKKNINFGSYSDISRISKLGSVQETDLTNFFTSKETSLSLASSEELNQKNLSVPVYQTNQTVIDTGRTLTSQEAILNLILQEADNPFGELNTTTTNSTSNNFSGTSQMETRKEDSNRNAIFSSFNSTETSTSSDFELSAGEAVPVITKNSITEVKVAENIHIPFNKIEGKFYVKYRLVNTQGDTIQTIIREIDHAELLKWFVRPTNPPDFSISSPRLGINNLNLRQTDLVADKVILSKRKTNTSSTTGFSNDFETFRVINLKFGEETTIKDNSDISSPIIYRAVSSKDGNESSKYSTAITAPLVLKSYISNYVVQASSIRTSAVLQTSVSPQSIGIKSLQIPKNVQSIKLSRRDLTANEKTFKPISNEPIKTVKNETSVSFLDKNTKAGHLYEYSSEYGMKNGSTIQSTGYSNQHFSPLNENSFGTGVSNTETTIQPNRQMNFSFKIDPSSITPKTDQVKTNLKNLGVDEQITEAENVVLNAVERINLTTGEVEDFGIIFNNEFDDVAYGNDNRTKPLNPDNDYEYKITTKVRKPGTLEKDKEVDVVDKFGREYCFKPRKFLDPKVLEDGTIKEEDEDLNEEFEDGDVGTQTFIPLISNKERPQIIAGMASHIGRKIRGQKANIVRWQISGNKNQVDTYIVAVERFGARTVAGVVSNKSKTNSFEFIDELEEGELGNLKYLITPIYNDFSSGKTFKTNSVLVR